MNRDTEMNTHFSMGKTEDILRVANEIKVDFYKKERKQQQECIGCYYSGRFGRMAGSAFRDYTCKICEKVHSWPNTSTPDLCSSCASEHKLCRRCMGKMYTIGEFRKTNHGRVIHKTTKKVKKSHPVLWGCMDPFASLYMHEDLDFKTVRRCDEIMTEIIDIIDEKLQQEPRTLLKIQVRKSDGMQGFAAYKIGTAKQKKAVMLMNIYASWACALEHDIPITEFLAENLMHEFGHALQDYLGMEFTESFVEKVTNSYREKYADKGYIEVHGDQTLPVTEADLQKKKK
jgi:hypothetical protein